MKRMLAIIAITLSTAACPGGGLPVMPPPQPPPGLCPRCPDQEVEFNWIAGHCVDKFRLYNRVQGKKWKLVVEVDEPTVVVVVPKMDVQWVVSGICLSGDKEGEWMMKHGVWTSAEPFKVIER